MKNREEADVIGCRSDPWRCPRTKRFACGAALITAMWGFCSVAAADPMWSPNVRIVSLVAFEDLDIVRIEVNPRFGLNPGECPSGSNFIDMQLDVRGRSAEEQRQLLNAINTAFITNRVVRFLLRDDLCSTAGTTLGVRIAVGVRVFN